MTVRKESRDFVRYSLLSTSDEGAAEDAKDEETQEQAVTSERTIELQKVIDDCEIREEAAQRLLSFWDESCDRRKKPFEEEIAICQRRKEEAATELNAELERLRKTAHLAPGPRALAWVDSDWFGALCNVIVVLNLVEMALEEQLQEYIGDGIQLLNSVFLIWYVVELLFKAVYLQWTLLFGPVSIVWWNWMDVFIVCSGVIEQWLVPLLTSAGMFGGRLNLSALRVLRLLRLLRILRVLKLVRAFVQGDFSWVQGTAYEAVGSLVLAVNSVTMAMELDHQEWPGWPWLNSIFLSFYSLDISCRLKFQGCAFFHERETLLWNYLDSIIVLEGIADQWVVPGWRSAQAAWTGEASADVEGGNQLGILKILRLMRILRLARLCKSIPPLYRVMQGVAQALGGLRWVVVLTAIVLYSAAIIFTTMVAQEIVAAADEERHKVALAHFGMVPDSLYSLFRIMNGDMEPAEVIGQETSGKMLLVGFIICANWAILAILTSVVSDNMIASSTAIRKKEQEIEDEEGKVRARALLSTMFKEIDCDSSGTIEENEWESKVIRNHHILETLCLVTALDKRELVDAFNAVAGSEPPEPHSRLGHTKSINYEEFMDYLLKDSRVPADKRSVLKIRSQLDALQQSQLESRTQMDELTSKVEALTRAMEAYLR